VLGSYVETGVELIASPEVVVRAANAGRVLFAGDMGVYGDVVIVDHGFGLSSIYSNLSFIACQEGQTLESGDQIGKFGSSGFNSGQHLQFEMRLHGTPIRPIEWWDKNWLKDHIFDRVKDVKKQLGIKEAEDLL
jgi:septal ring factor EnvC (AmiA/AmiB activator)